MRTFSSCDRILPTLINGSSSQFFYGPERQRWKQQASFGGTIEETVYIGGVLEKVTREGMTSWRHHIAGATGEVAIHTRKNDGTSQTHYLSRDHLGSVDAVSNGTGAVEVRTAFNAYGQRRNAAGWSGAPTAADLNAITGISRKGYTGHDMLDNLNLTHMNGRVYDQVAGRFLSADPFVQNPFDSQSLNRYSYVSNNPLSFTDPTGFQQAGPDDRPEPPKRRGGVVPNNERVRGTGSPGGGCKAEACLPRGYTPEEDAQFQQEYQIYLKNPVAFDQQGRGRAVGGPIDVLIGRRAFTITEELIASSVAAKTGEVRTQLVARPNCNISVALNPEACEVIFPSYVIENVVLTAIGGASLIRGAIVAGDVAPAAASTSRALVPYFPSNDGFLFARVRTFLQPGELIDRVGGTPASRFFSPIGTPIGMWALPPQTAGLPLRTFQVLKALEVDSGTVAPAFGQLGLGTQFRTTLQLQELLDQGFLKEIVR